jgi:hypothetical protein
VTYHFIITMAFGLRHIGFDGTYVLKPAETRAEAYGAILELTKQRATKVGIPTAQFVTLFFSFEPNELAA